MLKESVEQLIRDVYPMHMPGHKRNPAFLHDYSRLDLTEIDGADNLHAPKGMILRAEKRTASLFSARKTFYLTGGSTCGVLAAVTAATKPNDRVLVARNCHKSVYHALFAGSLHARCLFPALHPLTGTYGQVEPEAVEAALNDGDIAAVVITSPTYEGIVSDIRRIADAVHRAGALLIVDEAHGAHLGFSPYFPESARTLGADLVIESAHKTLPCLTGAALLHLCSDRVDPARVARMLSVYLTSSPPYPLLYSLDDMTGLIEQKGTRLFQEYAARLDAFYQKAASLARLRVYGGQDAFAFDRGKLLILCGGANCGGFELKNRLQKDYGIACEMALPDSVLAMTSIADTDEGFDRLSDALAQIDATLSRGTPMPVSYPDRATAATSVREAMSAASTPVALADAVGKTSAEFLLAYPPGSPLIVPGEIIGEQAIRAALQLRAAGAEVDSSDGLFPKQIGVIR